MRTRLLLQILPIVALAIAALTAIAVTAASSAQRDAVYGEMSELIGREANRFDARARADMAAAQDLAAALEADASITREHGRDVVRRFAERRPELLGTWAAFEPDAYDGRDADYRGVDPIGDANGRFAVWAQRIDGPLEVEAFEDAPDNPWADDDYYVRPLEAGGDVVLDPYFDSGAMMTSYTTAIKRSGRTVGVTGIDVALTALDEQTKAVEVLDSGYAFVVSPSGTLVAFPAQQKWTGKKTAKDIGVPPRPSRAAPAGSRPRTRSAAATSSCSTRR